jgi:RNA polymerase sigma-70 factor (ECF subfamily)
LDSERRAIEFPTTHWTLVGKAGDPSSKHQAEALAKLLRTYLPALKTYLVRAKRFPEERADDLVQDFISVKVLDKNVVAEANRESGRFRSYILTILDNFARSQWRKQSAAKRGAGRVSSLDDLPAGTADSNSVDPARTLAVEWARSVVQQATTRMQRECLAKSRTDIWAVFEAKVLRTGSASLAQLTERHGLGDSAQASNLLVTAKRMYHRNLRSVVGEYAREDEIDREIAELQDILRS